MGKYISQLSLRDMSDFAFYNKIKRYTIYSSNGFYCIDIKNENNTKVDKYVLSDFEVKFMSNNNPEKIENIQSAWQTFLIDRFGNEYLEDLTFWLEEHKLSI